jgi:D-arabinose 1-dehydrogenase-like Zn-dependent alcohol dehydrogenase
MPLPDSTRAMRIRAPGAHLTLETVALPRLSPWQVLLEVSACGVVAERGRASA